MKRSDDERRAPAGGSRAGCSRALSSDPATVDTGLTGYCPHGTGCGAAQTGSTVATSTPGLGCPLASDTPAHRISLDTFPLLAVESSLPLYVRVQREGARALVQTLAKRGTSMNSSTWRRQSPAPTAKLGLAFQTADSNHRTLAC